MVGAAFGEKKNKQGIDNCILGLQRKEVYIKRVTTLIVSR